MVATSFPCSLTISVPFPTDRLVRIAAESLAADPELSQLVRRELFLVNADRSLRPFGSASGGAVAATAADGPALRIVYSSTTPRMLRVSVNGCLASLRVILAAAAELDRDSDSADEGALARPLYPEIETEAEDGLGRSGGWARTQGLDTATVSFSRELL